MNICNYRSDRQAGFQYISCDCSFGTAEPIKKKKSYVKKASEIVKWLEDNGYNVSADGYWRKGGDSFTKGMWQFCNKELEDTCYEWHPEWIEER